MQFLRWHLVFSKKSKFADAVFIKERGTNVFIGKAYGHDGQEAIENAQLMADAPDMLTLLRNLLGDLGELGNFLDDTQNIRSAQAMLHKHGINLGG